MNSSDNIVESPAANLFEGFGLDARVLATVSELGFLEPTAIQAAAIPPLMQGRDVVARARTGTGKTAAFGLPLLEKVKNGERGVRVLVMTPTRELALQVTEALRSFATKLQVEMITVYGGAPYGAQLRALRSGVPVVVGTPGRMIDLLERGALDLSTVELVVLDEADEMLRMGFIDDVEKLLAAMPAKRQVGLFSATMPTAIRRVAEVYLKQPVNVEDASGGPSVAAIAQKYVTVPQRMKGEALLRLLRGEPRGTTIVFARTRAACGEAAEALSLAGFDVEALHGDMGQPQRERVVDLLRAKRLDMVVATDIAARGIDIDHITHVINFDLPTGHEVYTHRIGRTGRAGRTGIAISLVTPAEVRGFTQACQRSGAKLEEMYLPSDADIVARQRGMLGGELATALEAPEAAVAREWLAALTSETTSIEDLAAAALTLLAQERGLNLEATPSKMLPAWARSANAPAPTAPKIRPPRDARPDGFQRVDGPQRPAPLLDQDRPPELPTFELMIPIGRRHGLRPQDVVGALANELGIRGNEVGRIDIRDEHAIAGIPHSLGERLRKNPATIVMRGLDVLLDPNIGNRGAPPWAARPEPRRDEGPRDDRRGGFGTPHKPIRQPAPRFGRPR